MKTFTVFWHYVGNHGAYVREASNPDEACRSVITGFSEDFAKRAELVAVEGIHLMRKATAYDPDAEILADQGCSFLLKNDRRGTVMSRWVTNRDEKFVGKYEDESGAHPIRTTDVVEFLPAGGPGCHAGGGAR